VIHLRPLHGALLAAGGALLLASQPAWGQSTVPAPNAAQQVTRSGARELPVTVGKSLVVESPVNIQRVAVADPTKAEAMAVSPREVLVNGKGPGETSLIVWQQGGNRLLFDLRVLPSTVKLDQVTQEIQRELPGQDISLSMEGNNVFVRGTAKDMISAQRAINIATTLGKPVNLLNVKVPAAEQQILLKVRFANIDRSASQELGANLFATGALGNIGSVGTGQFTPPDLTLSGLGTRALSTELTLADALNVFLFRPDLNLGATIRALQGRNLLQILAEPNLLSSNGIEASFLAGGEFPVPIVQWGGITIQWREFGIRLNFVPNITPRGTIKLKVTPEVSSLDLSNALTLSGFQIPAISTRRVQTEIELQNGQSFAIAGLLDNRVIDSLRKIPGLGDIPLLGKLFQSRSMQKTNTELLVVVTPEIVRPVPEGMPVPGPQMVVPFMKGAPTTAPRTPPVSVTGEVPVKPIEDTVPFEQLEAEKKTAPVAAAPTIQLVPMVTPQQPSGSGAPPVAPAAPSAPVVPQQ
jgi:pilus assembly protein CpaC